MMEPSGKSGISALKGYSTMLICVATLYLSSSKFCASLFIESSKGEVYEEQCQNLLIPRSGSGLHYEGGQGHKTGEYLGARSRLVSFNRGGSISFRPLCMKHIPMMNAKLKNIFIVAWSLSHNMDVLRLNDLSLDFVELPHAACNPVADVCRREHYGKIMEVIDALNSTDSSAVAAVKSLRSEQLLEDILFIDSNFKIVSKSI
ncbi:hypothetical protein ANN_15921 [Periplaneta americana]|uniref:Uncharacterized protein n=1 Tax=Periplaneta americana TaxID=6978 RepID=A0ABQ8SIT7_PERAM|nr:hypothetical protein ANN_15921 [Periplaneta americana]